MRNKQKAKRRQRALDQQYGLRQPSLEVSAVDASQNMYESDNNSSLTRPGEKKKVTLTKQIKFVRNLRDDFSVDSMESM